MNRYAMRIDHMQMRSIWFCIDQSRQQTYSQQAVCAKNKFLKSHDERIETAICWQKRQEQQRHTVTVMSELLFTSILVSRCSNDDDDNINNIAFNYKEASKCHIIYCCCAFFGEHRLGIWLVVLIAQSKWPCLFRRWDQPASSTIAHHSSIILKWKILFASFGWRSQ